MAYGAIVLHKKESQVRIVTERGEVLDRGFRVIVAEDGEMSKATPMLRSPAAEVHGAKT